MARTSSFVAVALLFVTMGASGALATGLCPLGTLCRRCQDATQQYDLCKNCQTDRCMKCLANPHVSNKEFCLDVPKPHIPTCRDETCITCLATVSKSFEHLCVDPECNNHRCYGCVMSAPNYDSAKLCKKCDSETCVKCVVSKNPGFNVFSYGVNWKEYCTKCTSERCVDCLLEPAKYVPNEKLCLDKLCTSEACTTCLAKTADLLNFIFDYRYNEPYCLKCTSEACVNCVVERTKAGQSAHGCV